MELFRKRSMDELEKASLKQQENARPFPLVLVLDNLRSLSNVGSVFRTADALGVEKLCLCGFTGQPPHREIEKTALGATETVCWEYYPDVVSCLTELRENGYLIAALEQTTGSSPLQEIELGCPMAVVVGNEISGVSDEALQLSQLVVEIPQYGSKHSLNVAVSTGILVWQLRSMELKKQN